MSELSLTDLFCGAGGSSTGAIQVPGVEVRVASNHWQLAVDTHNTNHQLVQHICADLSQIDPRLFPTTDILWASPECTNHSRAKGRKKVQQADLFSDAPLPDEAAQRSRATMWDVPRFAEAHGYRAVIVENVADAVDWAPEWSPERGTLFRSWLATMDGMGYDHRVVYLNSMHAQLFGPGAPQSRDRLYVVFWRRGNPAPDIERVVRPPAVCPQCGPVMAMQVFKPGASKVARYRAQYLYRCPNVKCRNQVVEPAVRPAADIIDWSDLGVRIGDRPKPLATKTMARIQAGIERYWMPLIVEAAGNTYDAANPKHPAYGRPDGYMRAWPTSDPLRTVHTTLSKALAVPVEGREGKRARPVGDPLRTQSTRNETGLAFMAELRGGGSKHRPVTDPLATVTASGNHHGLVTAYYGRGSTTPASAPLPTCTTVDRHGLITPAGGTWREVATSTADPIPTRTAVETDGIAMGPTIDIHDVKFRMLNPGEILGAMDFPSDYIVLGNRREQVRMAGNAVTPPAARDLVGVVAESLGVVA